MQYRILIAIEKKLRKKNSRKQTKEYAIGAK